MKSNCRNNEFIESLKAIGCDVDKLNSLPASCELPKKLLKFVSGGGKTGFTKATTKENGDTSVGFYRVWNHPNHQ